jgi:hypothetical protein
MECFYLGHINFSVNKVILDEIKKNNGKGGLMFSPDSNVKLLKARLLVFIFFQSDQRKLLRK